MRFFENLKNSLKASDMESAGVKYRMQQLFMGCLNIDDLDGYQLVYGKHVKQGPNLNGTNHAYYNYIVGYKPDPVNVDIVLVPIEPSLTAYGAPMKLIGKKFRKAGKTLLSREYKLTNSYGSSFKFHVPAVNGKAANMFGGEEIAVNQEAEAEAFKAYFQQLQKLS